MQAVSRDWEADKPRVRQRPAKPVAPVDNALMFKRMRSSSPHSSHSAGTSRSSGSGGSFSTRARRRSHIAGRPPLATAPPTTMYRPPPTTFGTPALQGQVALCTADGVVERRMRFTAERGESVGAFRERVADEFARRGGQATGVRPRLELCDASDQCELADCALMGQLYTHEFGVSCVIYCTTYNLCIHLFICAVDC